MDKYIIRTSDRGNFKKCRRYWHYSSKIRENFEPVIINRNLEFGTAIHGGLEVWYDPQTWHLPAEVRAQMAEAAFLTINKEQRQVHDNIDMMLEEDYHERNELGKGMLRNFFKWAAVHDAEWTPVAVEQEFEVPVIVPQEAIYRDDEGNSNLVPRFKVLGFDIEFKDVKGFPRLEVLTYKGAPVVYQGRIDLAVEIDGEIWIVDHKTAASLKETMPELDVDSQVTSYAWAAQFYMDKPIAGVIYQQLKKAYPQLPKVLKSGKLSKDKSQATTAELYVTAVRQLNLNLGDYADIINYFEAADPEYVRRIPLHRGAGELKAQQEYIFYEAVDMLGDPPIYPNPGWSTCPSCPFKAPCLTDNDYPGEGRGVEMLEEDANYVRG